MITISSRLYAAFALIAAASMFGASAHCVLGEEPSNRVVFDRDVRPILANHCLQCHGPDSDKREAELRLDIPSSVFQVRDSRRVVNRDDPAQSELLVRISTDDVELRMPPQDSPSRPTAAEIQTLTRWIEQGAEWPQHWAYVPPQRPDLPTVSRREWNQNEIDWFVLARLDSDKLSPSSEADRFTLIRRVSLALTGMPPTPEEVDAFVADTSPDAYLRVVNRLLNSPRYGEHMALDWLDAARYADTAGYQADWERFMWPWRDWVVVAFNDNMPFDQFTIEQLAGDLLLNATMSQRLATGFNRNHRINDEGGSLDAEFEVEYVVDRVDTTATVWLGMTAGCARCHDHKYDPLSQREFYQLYAFFDNVPEKGIDGRKGFAVPHIDVPNKMVQWKLEQVQNRLEQIKRDDTQAELLKTLEAEVKQLTAKATTPVMVMQERPERKPTYLLKRGVYDQPDNSEVLAPSLPSVFQAGDDAPHDRLALAEWIVSPDNPLTARVIVNRIWQHHFGYGLVKTSEDFGIRGDPPSHPDLLDWLATEFVRTGWDVKAMHRLIVTSATYRQTSRVQADLQHLDPENRLFARGARRRLSGAAIRDQALVISGLLCQSMGGPSAKPYQPEGLWKELSFGTGKTTVDFYVQDHGSNLYRRGLYTFWKRTVAPPRMAVFDGGGREMCRVRSDRTNTPLQALTLQNDVTFVESARHMAERMIEQGANDEVRLRHGWRLALTRPPTHDELAVLSNALVRYRATFTAEPEQAEKLLATGESTRNEQLDLATHAAFTMVALSILNLDETITRE